MLGIYVRTSREGHKDESPIEQQKREGIKFAEKNNFEYQIYEDKGKSGYKIVDDDDEKPYSNRPGFVELMGDIRNGKIDMVWVYEHSRLSRNSYANAHIFHEFEKYKVKVYAKDSEFVITDKTTKGYLAFLGIMSEMERDSIVARTTRGFHTKINEGKRSFWQLYGYKKTGIDAKGLTIWEPVESEIENIKYGYKRILEGATLRQLTLELYNKKSFDKAEALRLSRYWYKILRHFSYTGYELNLEGLAVKRQFDDFEIDSLSALNDGAYYSKSKNYTVKIITIEKWIKVAERLRINRAIRKNHRNRQASRDLATGIIKCRECGQRYFSYTHENKQNGKTYEYHYYKHYAAMQNVIKCGQKKSYSVDNIDNIFKIFYFYYFLVFDNTAELIQESQRMIKTQQLKLTEQIKQYERDEKKIERQLAKFNQVLDETEDSGEIKILARRINETEEKQIKNFDNLAKAKIEFENLNEQYSGNEIANAYYNTKDKITAFFKKLSIEDSGTNY
jgi:DNA invertase Pin-like site-specific DNA recombinase